MINQYSKKINTVFKPVMSIFLSVCFYLLVAMITGPLTIIFKGVLDGKLNNIKLFLFFIIIIVFHFLKHKPTNWIATSNFLQHSVNTHSTVIISSTFSLWRVTNSVNPLFAVGVTFTKLACSIDNAFKINFIMRCIKTIEYLPSYR